MELRLAGIILDRKTAKDAVDELLENRYTSANVSVAARQYGNIYKKPEVDLYGNKASPGTESEIMLGGIEKKVIEEGGSVLDLEGVLMLAGPAAIGLGGAPVRVQGGGLTGVLRDMGFTDEQIEIYINGVDAGEVLIIIHTDDEHVKEIAGIMNRYNIMDLHITARRDRLVR